MNIALLQESGLPMRGLEGAWLMAAPNLITTSSSFAGQSSRRATWVESAATYAPGTNSKMWKLVEDDTASNTHEGLIAAGNIGAVVTASITAKAAERSHLRIYTNGGITYSQIFALSGAGSVSGGTSAGHTSTITALGDGCYRCVVAYTMSNVGLRVLLNNGSVDTYSGTGTAPYTEDDPGIYIADAQLNRGSTLLPYIATDALQTFASLYGKSPTLTRGATSAASTDDPTLDGWGWVFDGDDLGKVAAISGVTFERGITQMAVAKMTETGTGKYAMGLWAGAATGYTIVFRGAGAPETQWRLTHGKVGAVGSGDYLVLPTTDVVCFGFTSTDTVGRFFRCDNDASVLTTGGSPGGTPAHGIGSDTANVPAQMEGYAFIIWSRVLSPSELKRAYRAIKSLVYNATGGGVSVL